MKTLPKIEKGIPIPEPVRRKPGIMSVLRALKRGDSFAIDTRNQTAFSGYAAKIGIKVATRKIGEGRYRVWRIK